jgi:hypothetical protein
MLFANPFFFSGANTSIGPGIAIVGPGGSPGANVSDKYTFTSNTMTLGPFTNVRSAYACIGNYTVGYNVSGSAQATSDKLTYLTNTVTAGGNLASASYFTVGFGNATVGIIGAGTGGVVSKYAYSTDTVTTSPAIFPSTANFQLAAASTATTGVITGANNGGTTTSLYALSTDSISSGGALTVVRCQHAGGGNTTKAIFAGGYQYTGNGVYLATSDIYTYASNTCAGGSNLTAARNDLAGVSTPTAALFAGGYQGNSGVYQATVNIYNYSTAAMSTGTSLRIGRNDINALSTSPGGF